MPISVAVGSTNPVKVGAARRIFEQLFADVDIASVNVPSGVPDQPIGDEQTRQGAVNRAKGALLATGADFGVGMEGGAVFDGDGCWMNGFCAVAHKDGRVFVGYGGRFLLPPAVADAVRRGEEVGPVIDRLTGQSGTKKQGGAIGWLTCGAIVREDAFASQVACALVPFLHPELYADE